MIAVVTGMIASYGVGGVVWDYGQYAVGLERLGFDVFYLEDTGWQTYDPRKGMYGEDGGYGAEYLGKSLASLSPTLGRRWRFRNMDGTTYGLSDSEFRDVLGQSELFLNVSGSTLLRDEYMSCKRKVLIETDPGWNHFRNFPRWDANPGWQGAHSYREHDLFFTYAERIGKSDCVLPDLGLSWHPTRPPDVTDAWCAEPPGDTWTTVMTWKTYHDEIRYQGVTYGTKEIEFAKVEDIPSATQSRLELAVGGFQPPRERLREMGWSVIDSEDISKTPDDYRHYIQRSRGEFSVAKNVYVATRSGWFSCRSCCYLAAGRPVVVQDTGFSDLIPVGKGIVTFSNPEEAVSGIAEVEGNYAEHQSAAREIARTHFSSEVVLGDLLTRSGM
jgi:hypothetical protein